MTFDISDYVYMENPKTAFIIEWKGDNWAELIQFLRTFTRGWEASMYTTYESKIIVTLGDRLKDIILEPHDHLIVYEGGRDGDKILETDIISGFRKGRPNA